MISKLSRLIFGCALLACTAGCNLEHHAPLRSAELPPLAPTVLHASRLWLDLAERIPENDCISPGNARLLCFEGFRHTLGASLTRSLWTSFPGVEMARSGKVPPGDYVLHVDLDLEALPPDATGPGWSAGARGTWRLERSGEVLAGEQVASRSRAEFPYGAPLGSGASEVIDAIAVRIGMTLGGVAESRVVSPVPLPAVATSPLEALPTSAPANVPAPPANDTPPGAAPLSQLLEPEPKNATGMMQEKSAQATGVSEALRAKTASP